MGLIVLRTENFISISRPSSLELTMLFHLALVASIALLFYFLLESIKIPGILGMIIAGIWFGPYGLELISPAVLTFSADLRSLALVIILIRASLTISRRDLSLVAPIAFKMGMLALCGEAGLIALAGVYFWQMPLTMALMLGLIIAPVSPAIIVPRMMELKAKMAASKNLLPSILLTTTMLDNLVAITLFNVLVQLEQAQGQKLLTTLIQVPAALLLGVGIGVGMGLLFVGFFKKYHLRDTKKVLVFLLLALLLFRLEEVLPIPVSGLLGIMAMGWVIVDKYEILASRLAVKFSKIWIFAELVLFVLVGAQVNLPAFMSQMGSGVLLLIFLGLLGRGAGVYWALRGKVAQVKLFSLAALLPKATVQAALGAIPLTLGLPFGEMILGLSVASIVLTAPLGAWAISLGGKYDIDKF